MRKLRFSEPLPVETLKSLLTNTKSIRGSDGSCNRFKPKGPLISAADWMPLPEGLLVPLKRRSLLWMKAREAVRRRRDFLSKLENCS